jgi:hypothetical protein
MPFKPLKDLEYSAVAGWQPYESYAVIHFIQGVMTQYRRWKRSRGGWRRWGDGEMGGWGDKGEKGDGAEGQMGE